MADKKTEQPEQLTLSLPYEEIRKVMGRDKMRGLKETFTQGGISSFWVPFELISFRPGYNKRRDYGDVRDLADWIKAHDNKLPEPLKLDCLEDGRIWVDEGHRRVRAVELLISEGSFDPKEKVEFFPNNNKVTEYQRMTMQYISNNGSKRFTVLEAAEVAFDLKYNYGKELTDEEVAKDMGVSRQTITNYIQIASAPDDIKNEIMRGDHSATDALALIRRQRKDKKQAESKEEESHITSGAAASLPPDPLKKDIEELNDLEQQAEDFNSEEARANRERIAFDRLCEIANEVLCNREDLMTQLGKRLAKDATVTITEQVLDEESGELRPEATNKIVVSQETELEEIVIDMLIEAKVGSVFIYKGHSIAKSVITEPVAEPEKGRYDISRPEIAQIQNIIGLSDKMAVRIEKLDISDGDKKDLLDWIKWQQNDLWPLRDWIHSNKKQNKIR